MILGRTIRNCLSRLGYVVLRRDAMRFGYSLFEDVTRVSRAWDCPIDTVFDVGANVGQFGAEALTAFPAARVHSFEPHPTAFARLCRNISDSRLTPHRLALGAETGEATLYVYGADDEASKINSLTPNARYALAFGHTAREEKVRCTTIDALCREHDIGSIDLLKIDTEGFDLYVLHGAERMLREGRVRFVYVEFNDLFPKPGTTGGALLPIADYLARFGQAYLCSYTDFIALEGTVLVGANALFAAPPAGMR